VDKLRELFEEALTLPGVVGLNIATRADCLEDDVVEYLSELAARTVLTVELGLQSTNDETAQYINRGHTFADFVEGYEKLRRASSKIGICVHLIFGLPGEDDEIMLNSVRQVAALAPDQVKLHLLHVLRSSRLGAVYERGEYIPMERDHYIDVVTKALTLLPPDTVVARLTGDGMGDDLLAPDWSRKKVSVINDIDKRMYELDWWQGKQYGMMTAEK
jgi:radical SAM protein (TIGR01212 family)